MEIKQKKIKDVFVAYPEIYRDERGEFSRQFCIKEMGENMIKNEIMQTNISVNPRRGTLRGMHCQKGKYAEDKVITCITGSVMVALIDIRTDSPTYLEYEKTTLDSKEKASLYVPAGCATGWITKEDNTILSYLMMNMYRPGEEFGIRYNDPNFNIDWETEIAVISKKDMSYPDFSAV